MINWFDMPAEGLSNGGLFEVKELEVTENGTYETSGEMYNKVTVNVEGGGGSSDFSTAEVSVTIGENAPECELYYSEILDNEDFTGILPNESFFTGEYLMPLYKGVCEMYIRGDNIPNTVATTGNVTYEAYPDDNMGVFHITGDCTITIS